MFTEIAHRVLSSILNTVYGVSNTRWASVEEHTNVSCLGVGAWCLSDACEVLECHKISDAVLNVTVYIDRAREIWGVPSLMGPTVEALTRLFTVVECREITIGLHRHDRAEHIADLLSNIPTQFSKHKQIRINNGTIAWDRISSLEQSWKDKGLNCSFWEQNIEVSEEQWKDRKTIPRCRPRTSKKGY